MEALRSFEVDFAAYGGHIETAEWGIDVDIAAHRADLQVGQWGHIDRQIDPAAPVAGGDDGVGSLTNLKRRVTGVGLEPDHARVTALDMHPARPDGDPHGRGILDRELPIDHKSIVLLTE